MAIYYVDTSALVKRYIPEVGTVWVGTLLDSTSGNRIYIASITGVEVTAAFARLGRGDVLSATTVVSALAQFRYDFAHQYRVVEPVRALIHQAMALAEKHALRGYDAVQLAAAIVVNERRLVGGLTGLTLISADQELNTAALAEGLAVDDPNAHP